MAPPPPIAPPATSASDPPPQPARSLPPLPSRNPIPLSAAQEAQVRETYYKRVRTICADEIRDFAACARGRTFSAVWTCRQQKQAMNGCMITHATQEEQDRAREEWFATHEERVKAKKERDEKARRQEAFHKHWWGIDETGRWGQDRKTPTGKPDDGGEKTASR